MYNVNFPMVARSTAAAPPQPAATTSPTPQPKTGGEARNVGWLNVRTVPPGAQILIPVIGGRYTSPRRLDLAPGEYTLTIFMQGYKPVKKTVTVTADKETALNESLRRSSP